MRYKPRNRRSAEEIAAEKAKADRLAMTCQCCARRIFAQTGVIAHHGYQRPSWAPGNQTASCLGARHLPYEADRAVLGELIGILEAQIVRIAKHRFDVQAEREPIFFEYTDYTEKVYVRGHNIGKVVRVPLTRDTFAAQREAHINPMRASYRFSFDEFKEDELNEARRRMSQMAREIRGQRKRFAEWKQTHTFSTFYNPPQWVKIEAGT